MGGLGGTMGGLGGVGYFSSMILPGIIMDGLGIVGGVLFEYGITWNHHGRSRWCYGWSGRQSHHLWLLRHHHHWLKRGCCGYCRSSRLLWRRRGRGRRLRWHGDANDRRHRRLGHSDRRLADWYRRQWWRRLGHRRTDLLLLFIVSAK